MVLPQLPVLEVLDELQQQLLLQPKALLQAPPGAGKSTLLPLALLRSSWLGNQKIILLEPRRLAARSVAMRMASLLGEAVGETVGYRVRFETKISAKTKIEVVTEGILTRMLQSDNALEGIGLVIFDEFHERSIHSDLSLALCAQAQSILRPDLRILVMSATLDAFDCTSIFQDVPVVRSEGKLFEVSIKYLKVKSEEAMERAMCQLIVTALKEEKGDLLCFLPGAREIRSCAEQLSQSLRGEAVVKLLYGDLPFAEQQNAILPDLQGRRKVVLATSIAETSLTIEGVSVVIDSGLMRVQRFDLRSGLSHLRTLPITQDAAAQRAGRAGRLGPGVCYRMWTAATQSTLYPHRTPEIIEADLAGLALELACWGINDPLTLDWVTPPPLAAFQQAQDLLGQLKAVENGKITALGRKMAQLPCHPRLAHLVLQSTDKMLAADVAALLEEKDPLGKEKGCDFVLRIEALRRYRAQQFSGAGKSFEKIEQSAKAYRKLIGAAQPDNGAVAEETVGAMIALAYPERIAKKHSSGKNRYKLANGKMVRLPENDALENKEWISIAQLDGGGQEGRIYLAAALDKDDLLEDCAVEEYIVWDRDRKQLVGTQRKSIGALVVEERLLHALQPSLVKRGLLDALRTEGLAQLLDWSEAAVQLQNRVASLRLWRPEEEWPDLSTEQLQLTADQWLIPYLDLSAKGNDLKQTNVKELLMALVPYALQNQLEKLAPSYMEVPSGSKINIQYFESGKAPELYVRLQEVFGLLEAPRINDGKTRLLIHLLSPARRPVQVTQDLMSFWSTTYKEVRKELKIRYPKHAWPEDPFTAVAVKGPIRKKTK